MWRVKRKLRSLPSVRIELTAFGLQDQRSATELRRRTLKTSSRCNNIPNYLLVLHKNTYDNYLGTQRADLVPRCSSDSYL